jgi:hypothetical protein
MHCMCVHACSSRLDVYCTTIDRFLEQVGHAVLDPVSPARSSTRMCTPCLVPISTCLTWPRSSTRMCTPCLVPCTVPISTCLTWPRSSTRMCTPCLVPISTCLTWPTRDSRVACEHSDSSHISAPTTLSMQAARLIACMNFQLLHDSPGQHVSSSTRTLTRSHAHTLTRSHAHTPRTYLLRTCIAVHM